eukprot:1879414-Pleurochrysis_carterae.AAC.1
MPAVFKGGSKRMKDLLLWHVDLGPSDRYLFILSFEVCAILPTRVKASRRARAPCTHMHTRTRICSRTELQKHGRTEDWGHEGTDAGRAHARLRARTYCDWKYSFVRTHTHAYTHVYAQTRTKDARKRAHDQLSGRSHEFSRARTRSRVHPLAHARMQSTQAPSHTSSYASINFLPHSRILSHAFAGTCAIAPIRARA